MDKPPDDRSVIAEAFAWSTRITTVALEMVIPGAIGYWLDQRLGTVIVFVVLGVILGMTTGLMHLLRMVQPPDSRKPRRGPDRDNSP